MQPAFASEHSLHRWCCARRDWQPSSTQCAIYNLSPLFVRKPPRGAVGSPLPSTSCVCKKIVNPKSAAQRLAVAWTHPAWCPRPGAPPGAEGGPAASQLPALMCKCHRAAAGLAKGLPTGCWPQSLGWSSSQWCSLVDAAATSTASTPTANISIVVKHIDGGRGGEGRGRRRAPCACRRPIAASTASVMARGTSSAWPGQQWPASRCSRSNHGWLASGLLTH